LVGIEDKIAKLAPTDDEFRCINAYLTKVYGTGLETKSPGKMVGLKNFDYDAYCEGAEAAESFELHRPIEEQELAIEHNPQH
jgi:hypothetical protein